MRPKRSGVRVNSSGAGLSRRSDPRCRLPAVGPAGPRRTRKLETSPGRLSPDLGSRPARLRPGLRPAAIDGSTESLFLSMKPFQAQPTPAAPLRLRLLDCKHLQCFVSVVVDDFDGDFARFRAVEGAAGG